MLLLRSSLIYSFSLSELWHNDTTGTTKYNKIQRPPAKANQPSSNSNIITTSYCHFKRRRAGVSCLIAK